MAALKAVSLLLLLLPNMAAVRPKYRGAHLLTLNKDYTDARLNSLQHRQRRDASSAAVDIRQFHMDSKLYSRFATVRIESELVNTAQQGSKEVAFTVQIPETAFMSNFTMTVDGTVYVAKVLEKADAQKRYDEAKAQNQTAGQVRQVRVDPARGMEIFTINVNLSPGSSAYFILTYNELLERRRGIYRQRLFLQPGGIVANMSVQASFTEGQGFKSFSYRLLNSTDVHTASTDDVILYATPTSKSLTWNPSEEFQRNFDSLKGIHGEFVIEYDVEHETGGGNIILQNQHFVHYFAPPGLAPLPKNILFVIDISGSMGGEKILQAREAMIKILDELRKRSSDHFNILLFDDELEKWEPEPMRASKDNTDRAQGYVREKLHARGSTNIYDALMTGLDILLGSRAARDCHRADMIVFLTDGDPTAGRTTNTKAIVEFVTGKNKGRASIFSLAFGFDMNFDFLSELSEKNRGFARRIYPEGDAAIQLENFYDEIGTPVLCDVTAAYNNEVVEVDLLTMTQFPLFFDGKEIIVSGKTKASAQQLDLALLDAQVSGTDASGVQSYAVQTDKVVMLQEPDVEDDLTEKLWAYMYIKKLLRNLQNLTSEAEKNATRQEALQISLDYGFVTPLTSFSIVVDNAPTSENDWKSLSFDAGAPGRGGSGLLHKLRNSGNGYKTQADWSGTCRLSESVGLFVLVMVFQQLIVV